MAVEACGRAREVRMIVPGTTAQHAGLKQITPPITTATFPRVTIQRCILVVLMPEILAPLPHIAVHLIQAKGIGRERTNRHSLLPVFALGGAIVGVIAIEAGTQTAYPWGDDPGSNNTNCNGRGSPWDCETQKVNSHSIYSMTYSASQA